MVLSSRDAPGHSCALYGHSRTCLSDLPVGCLTICIILITRRLETSSTTITRRLKTSSTTITSRHNSASNKPQSQFSRKYLSSSCSDKECDEYGLHHVYWDVVPRILRTSGKSHNATLSLTCYVTLSWKFRTGTFLILSTWWWSSTYTLVAIFRCCEQDYLLCHNDQLLMMYCSLQTFSLAYHIFTDCIHLFYYCFGAGGFSRDALDGDIHRNDAYHRCFPVTLPSPIGLIGERGAG